MPLDKFVLLIVGVIAAAGVTVWIGAMVAATIEIPVAGWLLFFPAMLVGYVIWRVISDRLGNREDDYYDKIEK